MYTPVHAIRSHYWHSSTQAWHQNLGCFCIHSTHQIIPLQPQIILLEVQSEVQHISGCPEQCCFLHVYSILVNAIYREKKEYNNGARVCDQCLLFIAFKTKCTRQYYLLKIFAGKMLLSSRFTWALLSRSFWMAKFFMIICSLLISFS